MSAARASWLRTGLVALLLAAGCGGAMACRCTEPSAAAAYRGADAVVQARVVAVSGDPEAEGGAVVRLTVDRSWKSSTAAQIDVATRSTCAYPFAVGQDLLVYLTRAGGAAPWFTQRCRGNRPLAEAAGALGWLARHGRPAASPASQATR